jgi:peptidoglycan hydrolase-like protein with peptidoglycan-binding domain
MRRLRVVFAMLLAAAAVGVGYLATTRPRVDPAATPVVRTTVASVTRGTVTERVQVPGTLGYDGSYPVVNHLAPGVVTGLADLGATVNRGGTLYAVDNQAVRLLFGAVPAYRGFAAGMADGPDVAELEANLAALGFAPGTVDNHFNAATAAAIRRWQASWGWPASARTGALAQGAVVFLPGLVRVSQLQGALGGGVGPGAPVLTATSVDRVVTAQVTADRQALVHVGDRVVVTMPGAAPVPGQVIRVGRVATAATQSGAGPPAPATLPVTVSVQLPSGAPDLDQAPVQVAIATRQHTDVLLVPVAALLAKPGGGYQVRLASGAFVPVQPGLFDETAGLVEVTGVQLGDQVEVPAP